MTDTNPLPDDHDAPATKSFSWTPPAQQTTARCRRTAFFRRVSGEWVLQHIRTVTLRQRGATTSDVDTGARPIDLPLWVREKVGLDGEESGEQARV